MGKGVALSASRTPSSGIRLTDRGQGGSTTPNTSLTIVALNAWVGRAVFHLRCGPPGGDVPDSAKACAALDQRPELVTSPEQFVCRGGPGSHWVVQINGWMSGQTIRQSFETCWTLQMPMLEQLELTWEVLGSIWFPGATDPWPQVQRVASRLAFYGRRISSPATSSAITSRLECLSRAVAR